MPTKSPQVPVLDKQTVVVGAKSCHRFSAFGYFINEGDLPIKITLESAGTLLSKLIEKVAEQRQQIKKLEEQIETRIPSNAKSN